MYLTIVLRKEVPDRDAAAAIYELVKERFADRPDIIINGNVTNHFDQHPPPQ